MKDKFWSKAQPYALQFMMDNDPWATQFEGGTVYQAFLSALSYHRWHAPVSGTVVKTYLVEGSYYSEALSEGNDPSAPNDSQGYIAEVATRALIFIEADNPDIGLMCFMAVGMAEVSTCDVKVYEGQHLTKGQETRYVPFRRLDSLPVLPAGRQSRVRFAWTDTGTGQYEHPGQCAYSHCEIRERLIPKSGQPCPDQGPGCFFYLSFRRVNRDVGRHHLHPTCQTFHVETVLFQNT